MRTLSSLRGKARVDCNVLIEHALLGVQGCESSSDKDLALNQAPVPTMKNDGGLQWIGKRTNRFLMTESPPY
jgi:hypothetical protein